MLRGLLLPVVALALVAGCATSAAAPSLPPAPWSQPVLGQADVPAVYLSEWRKAANGASCAPIAPAGLGSGEGGKPRRANFSGGWAVAYDKPDLRSAFGVAGTGSRAADPAYTGWEFSKDWADGSMVGYGLEGGTGPGYLAYLRIAGQDCLYNVWSNIGREHLEFLIDQLRFVDTQ